MRIALQQHLLVLAPTWSEPMVALAHTDYYRCLVLPVRSALAEIGYLPGVEQTRAV